MAKPHPKLPYEPPSIKGPFPGQGKPLPAALGQSNCVSGKGNTNECTNGANPGLKCSAGQAPPEGTCSGGSSPPGPCQTGTYWSSGPCGTGAIASGPCLTGSSANIDCMSGAGPSSCASGVTPLSQPPCDIGTWFGLVGCDNGVTVI
jgi:hypothetical protein